MLTLFKMLARRTVVFSPTFHKPQNVSVTPKMVHMVQNKHNFESHSKGERPIAVKATLWGGVVSSSEAIQGRGFVPTEMTVTWLLALCPDLTFNTILLG